MPDAPITPTPATPTGADLRRGPLLEGDRVQLTDGKGRMHTITLSAGTEFHTHRGRLQHDDLIGAPDGSVVTNTAGMTYLALRPLLADYVMSMPRGAAVVYPKDSGQIVMMADIFPGATVVEAGVGSGALSMSLLRAVGEHGRLISFERRDDFAAIAQANARTFFGKDHPAWQVVVGGKKQYVAARPSTLVAIVGLLKGTTVALELAHPFVAWSKRQKLPAGCPLNIVAKHAVPVLHSTSAVHA